MKVLIHSSDVIGPLMAGPGIRYWEFARALSAQHEVTLRIPNQPAEQPDSFRLVHDEGDAQIAGHDVLVSQFLTPSIAQAAQRAGVRMVLDAYDPVALEDLERHRSSPLSARHRVNSHTVSAQSFSLCVADSIICASERQRDLWMGALLALGRVTPEVYDHDVSLRALLDVVPFGLPSAPPPDAAPRRLRSSLGLSAADFVMVWGGGIWDWFDPLSLIRAVAELRDSGRTDIKLVFLGLQHPNPAVGEMEMCRRAMALADDLSLAGNQVHFNIGWIPYSERATYLLDADCGVSTHTDHVEARYAFRTRILDYIWAQLPIVCTTGDTFGDSVEQDGIGLTAAPGDVAALVAAIRQVVDDRARRDAMRQRLGALRATYAWPVVVRPLERQVRESRRIPPLRAGQVTAMAARYYGGILREALRDEGVTRTLSRGLREYRAVGWREALERLG